MDREGEEFHFLDAFGIVGEALKIVRREAKLLGAIALTLLLPLSFVIHGYTLFSASLLNKIMMSNVLLGIEAGSPAAESVRHGLHTQLAEFVVLTTLYATLAFAFLMLSRSAVLYTVACIYAGKELCYTKVMSIVPKVWKRLAVTFLWVSLVMFLCNLALAGGLFCWFLLFGVVGLKTWAVFVVVVIVIVALFFHVYIATVWELASVVCVVEHRQGLDALKKSKQVMRGKRDTALTLYFLYALLVGVISGFQSYSMYGERKQGMSVGVIAAVVVLQCVVDLVWLLTQAVLYFVCKSSQHEDIDKLTLSKHLEMYNGGYLLLDGASMQFEMSSP